MHKVGKKYHYYIRINGQQNIFKKRKKKYFLKTIVWFVPVALDTVENCTPDDGRIKHPKHVEWT